MRCYYSLTHAYSLTHSLIGVSFLKKHMKTKHEYFNYDTQVHQAESYMKALYEAENVAHRPLPPIELEGSYQ